MGKTISEKTDMNMIEKALKEEDFCDAMRQLGFMMFGYDEEYPDDYYFMAKDNSLIVFLSRVNAIFYTYSKANNRYLL